MTDVTVNGEPLSLPEGSTVRDLLARLEVGTEGVAVEVNRAIVPRGRHADTVLVAEDEIEIVTFVGGG